MDACTSNFWAWTAPCTVQRWPLTHLAISYPSTKVRSQARQATVLSTQGFSPLYPTSFFPVCAHEFTGGPTPCECCDPCTHPRKLESSCPYSWTREYAREEFHLHLCVAMNHTQATCYTFTNLLLYIYIQTCFFLFTAIAGFMYTNVIRGVILYVIVYTYSLMTVHTVYNSVYRPPYDMLYCTLYCVQTLYMTLCCILYYTQTPCYIRLYVHLLLTAKRLTPGDIRVSCILY